MFSPNCSQLQYYNSMIGSLTFHISDLCLPKFFTEFVLLSVIEHVNLFLSGGFPRLFSHGYI